MILYFLAWGRGSGQKRRVASAADEAGLENPPLTLSEGSRETLSVVVGIEENRDQSHLSLRHQSQLAVSTSFAGPSRQAQTTRR